MSQPHTVEVTERLEADKAAHREYSKGRYKSFMRDLAAKKYGIAFLVPDYLSTRCVFFAYTWSDQGAKDYLESDILPAQLSDFNSEAGQAVMIFAQLVLQDQAMNDMGKPVFLHATHSQDPVAYCIGGVGISEFFRKNMVFFIPGDLFNTPELWMCNEEYLRTGVKPANSFQVGSVEGLAQQAEGFAASGRA